MEPVQLDAVDQTINEVIFQSVGDDNTENSDEEPDVELEDSVDWKPIDNMSQLHKFDFSESKIGIREDLLEKYFDKSAYDVFRLFFTDHIINHIVIETNRYAEQVKASITKPKSRVHKWTDTNADEIELFFALLLWMGLCRFPSITDYWSSDEVYKNELPKYMSRNRFQLILRMLHFSDNENTTQTGDNPDRLRKIRPLLNLLTERFQYVMVPPEDVCIDETLVPFRGRVGFRQYIKNKRHKFGIKLYKLCIKDGYTYSLSVYCGKSTDSTNLAASEKVVLDLMEPLLEKGRTLFVDNYYTSVRLAKLLLSRKTYLVGTLRNRRKLNCKEVEKANLKKGEVIARICNPGIVILKWRDKRDVLALSTKHLNEMIRMPHRNDPDRKKPRLIVDYNKSKAYIDLSDQQKAYNTPLRRGVKWYRKLAVEIILGTTLVNAFVTYIELTKDKISITKFKQNILKYILKKNTPEIATLPDPEMESHELEHSGKRLRCVVCYENVREEYGRMTAQNKTPRSTWSCCVCKKSYCINCFFHVHKSVVK